MKKGDIIYVPQNTRIMTRAELPRSTKQPHRAIYLNEHNSYESISEIFLCGEKVMVKNSDIYEWRENDVGSGDSGERFNPSFFPNESLHKS